eukprot:360202-Chlamydomonas_euryale.AAC.15
MQAPKAPKDASPQSAQRCKPTKPPKMEAHKAPKDASPQSATSKGVELLCKAGAAHCSACAAGVGEGRRTQPLTQLTQPAAQGTDARTPACPACLLAAACVQRDYGLGRMFGAARVGGSSSCAGVPPSQRRCSCKHDLPQPRTRTIRQQLRTAAALNPREPNRDHRTLFVAYAQSINWLRYGTLPVFVVEGITPEAKSGLMQRR